MANYVLLETISLSSNTASVTFDNIPQSGYTDLKFVMSARQSTAAVAADVLVTFNGSTANHSNRYLLGDSASASSGFNGYTPSSNYIAIGVGNNATANTFGNVEMYIPNYLSSNNKSFSVDSVSESNGTSSVFQLMLAGLWSSSAAINQITVTPASSQSFLQYSTFSLYGLAATGTTSTVAPKATGGNVVYNDGTYWYHTFLTSGYFTPLFSLSANYYVLGGGATGSGGGSSGSGGGGGGGGSSYVTSASLLGKPYAVTIGAGGPTGGAAATAGSVGSNSTFNSTVGGGGQQQSSFSTASPGGTGTTQNGGNGGIGYPSGNAQNGGAGYTNPLDSVTRGGGGSTKSGTQGTGTNGGGNGVGSGTGGNGTANTGGGGGGSAQDNIGYGGGGGSGIVIIRYAI